MCAYADRRAQCTPFCDRTQGCLFLSATHNRMQHPAYSTSFAAQTPPSSRAQEDEEGGSEIKARTGRRSGIRTQSRKRTTVFTPELVYSLELDASAVHSGAPDRTTITRAPSRACLVCESTAGRQPMPTRACPCCTVLHFARRKRTCVVDSEGATVLCVCVRWAHRRRGRLVTLAAGCRAL